MKIARSADQPTRRGPAETFTGAVWLRAIAAGETPEPLHVVRVIFEPGARTFWHHHPRGQILIATAGMGRFQLQDGPLLALHPGDSVSIAPGEVHWHWHRAGPAVRPHLHPGGRCPRRSGSIPSATRRMIVGQTSCRRIGSEA